VGGKERHLRDLLERLEKGEVRGRHLHRWLAGG
jgi:hypothetical protein